MVTRGITRIVCLTFVLILKLSPLYQQSLAQAGANVGSLGGMVGGFLGSVLSGTHGRRINAVSYSLPTPPVLYGPTTPNQELVNAEKVHMGLINGPASFAFHQGELFAGTRDNKVYNLARCKPKLVADLSFPGCEQTSSCGQLTSLRRDPSTGDLIALDTDKGLFRIKNDTGTFEQIYSVDVPVNGRPPVHLNDLVVTKDGIIIMSDSSDAHEFGADVYIGMEGRTSGRLISFVPSTGVIREFLPNVMAFPNGLELTPEGNLLVAETGRVRILRVSLQRATWLQVSVFAQNLPGLPDNIRASDRGTYWVGMSYVRHSRSQNPMDRYAGDAYYRQMGAATMSYQSLQNMFSKYGMAVELNAAGAIIKSLQDPSGQTISMVTEVNEFGGVMNIGSPDTNYLARIVNPQRGLKADSFIAVARSRCQLDDSKVAEARKTLEAQMSKTAVTVTPAKKV
nr:adipocyte plasma membrane-associated protein [Biomphalaria glabrata]